MNIIRFCQKRILAILAMLPFFIFNNAYAEEQKLPSLGDLSTNALQPVSAFAHILYNICYILGAVFIMGSIVRFKEYRENPSQTPISRPILVFIFGLVFILVPFIAKLSSSST